MLAVPLKESTKLDFSDSLGSYIKKHFTDVADSTVEESIKKLNSMRTEVLKVASSQSPSTELSINLLSRYARQILMMRDKFPVGESKNGVQLSFQWGDAFKPKKKVTQYSLTYELGSVLFNLGAAHSIAGLNCDRDSAAGLDVLKVSAKHFQQAAGVFGAIKDSVCPQMKGATSSDLSLEGLQMIIDLMLAQAQALFYKKCLETPAAKLTRGNEKMKSSLCAKLAAETETLFSKALKIATNTSLASVLSGVWINHIKLQKHCYASAAWYKQSEVVHANAEKTGAGYGMEIACLAKAERESELAMVETQAKGSKIGHSERSNVSGLLSKIKARKKEREEDNELIYCESIPDESALPTIEGKAIAKAIVPDTIPLGTGGNRLTAEDLNADLFRTMIPGVVRKAALEYESQLSTMLTEVEKQCNRSSHSAREVLASLGLPAAVEAQIQSVGLPDSVWGRVQEVNGVKGGVAALAQTLGRNSQAAQEARSLLQQVRTALEAEAADDSTRRASEQHQQWSLLAPSSSVNVDLMNDLTNYENLLESVGPSDAFVGKLLEDNGGILKLLGKTRGELASKMPPMTVNTVAAAAPVRKKLVATLKELSTNLAERSALLRELKGSVGSDNIVAALMKAGCGTSNDLHNEWTDAHAASLFDFEKSKFQPQRGDIGRSMKLQTELLDSIKVQNVEFQQLKGKDPNTKHREVVLDGINRAIDCYMDIYEKVKQGETFYSDMIRHLQQLLQTTRDFCQGRRMEVEDLANSIEAQSRAYVQMEADAAFAKSLERSKSTEAREEAARADQMAKDAELAMQLQNMGRGGQQYAPPPYGAAPTAPPPSFASDVPAYSPPQVSSFAPPPISGHTVPPSYDSVPSYNTGQGNPPLPTYGGSQSSASAYDAPRQSYGGAPPAYGVSAVANGGNMDVENERLAALDKFDR